MDGVASVSRRNEVRGASGAPISIWSLIMKSLEKPLVNMRL